MMIPKLFANARRAAAIPVLAVAACGDGQAGGPSATASSTVAPPSSAAGRSATSATSTSGPGSKDVVFEIRDAATKAPMPGKLTFVGVRGTPSPAFTTTDAAVEADRSIRAWNRVWTLSGDGRVEVPPGTYDIYVTRGPEWSMHAERGVALGTSEVTIQAELAHEIETPGWISGDFHVHAERSWDSKVPMRARVVEFVAEGVDLLVATDHNAIADYAPIVRDLGLDDVLATMRGDEVTTKDWGHFGVFPLGDVTPFATKQRTPADILKEVRERAPDALIDVNHPRFDRGLGYFRTGIFDRTQAKFGRTGASMEFDAIEVLNGYEGSRPDQVDDVMKDWFSLMEHGYFVAAMGNSDTHRLDTSLAGYPRNFLPVKEERIASVGAPEITAAIRQKRSFLTTAPFVDVTSGSARSGDTVKASGGKVTIHVRVRAASWVKVDTLSVFVGNEVAATRPLAKEGTTRFDGDITVDAPEDTWIVTRVDGKEPLPLVVGDGDKLVAYPLAVTNPIFVDADGDGRCAPRSGPK